MCQEKQDKKEPCKNYTWLKKCSILGPQNLGSGAGPLPDLRLDSPWRLNIFKLETPLRESIKCHNFHGEPLS